MKKLLSFLHQKIPSESLRKVITLSARIMKYGLILSVLIAVFYIAYKLSWDEIKSVLLYYYSKFLVFGGGGYRIVHAVNSSGTEDIILAADLIKDPFTLLLKHDFYWTILRGFIVGYVSLKIFWLMIILWYYIKSKIHRD